MQFHNVMVCLAVTALTTTRAFAVEVVVDNDQGAPEYVESGAWRLSASPGYNGGTYHFASEVPQDVLSTATWTPLIPTTGPYDVFALFRSSTNRSTDVPLTITHAGGSTNVSLDQSGANQVVEIYIGTFTFNAGTGGSVTMTNDGPDGAYIADAFRFSTPGDDPPVVGSLAINPATPDDDDPVTVTATVTDDVGIASVTLNYSASPSGASNSVTAFDDGAHGDGSAGDGVYGATIPAFPMNEVVTYSMTAIDTISQSTSSASASYTVGQTAPAEFRVLWADSWNASFLNSTQAQDIVDTCRASNINTIMIEVRKIGDAYYNSSLEPRATNISGGPSFDPLGNLIALAHDTSGGKKRIQVHAWFVMHRISKGETLSPMHVLSQHPEYIMSDDSGATSGGGSIFLDPGHPGTVNHNVAVIVDCLQNYDIDGINLDYIRYPEAAGEWGYNPVSVARFNAFYNKTGQPSGSDPDWDTWRRRNVTNEVKKIYIKTKMVKPTVLLTADTIQWGSSYSNFAASEAYRSVFQDWVGWLQEGILDYNALMNYATSNVRYQGWTDLSLANDDIRGSIIGIGAYLQTTIQNSMDQLLYARANGAAGLNIYDWGSEVNAVPGGSRTQFYTELKSQVFPTWADPPTPSWIAAPTKGIFEGNVTASGVPVDHALVTIDGNVPKAVYTDGSGWYGALELTPGVHELRFSKPGYTDKVVNATIPAAGNIITVNVDFADSGVTGWMLLQND
ncbi:family 10 glycosylhydrolase [Candidatus Sumerlaeota bacterium]|nr:family 10 glycosylhydrolase [Candidatus Sumerlaeota bacterium]